MLDLIRADLESHEGDPGIIGYALVIFTEDGSATMDCAVSGSDLDDEVVAEEELAIAGVAACLGFDDEGVVLQ